MKNNNIGIAQNSLIDRALLKSNQSNFSRASSLVQLTIWNR